MSHEDDLKAATAITGVEILTYPVNRAVTVNFLMPGDEGYVSTITFPDGDEDSFRMVSIGARRDPAVRVGYVDCLHRVVFPRGGSTVAPHLSAAHRSKNLSSLKE